MYTVYISDYLKDGSYVSEPTLLYDTRSPANDITVLDPVCDLEDSKAGSFTFTLPLNHYLYNSLKEKRTLATMWRDEDDPEKRKIIFEGVVTSANRDLYKNKKVYCEGFATFLNDTCQPRKEYFSVFMKDYVEALITEHNAKYSTRDRKFEVIWDDDNIPYFPNTDTYETTIKNVEAALNRATPGTPEYDMLVIELNTLLENRSEYQSLDIANISVYEATQFDSTFAYLQDLQERTSGHFIFGVNDDPYSACKYTIKFIRKIPEPVEGAQEIRFGLNLLDYTDSLDYTNICTAILPVASLSNYSQSNIGEIVAMFPDGDKVIGEFNYITEKITVDGVERYEFTDQNTENGDYIYVINSWPNRDDFFSQGGAHHLLKIIDKSKLAETVTDPDERKKAYEIVSGSVMVYWGAQLGDKTDGFSNAQPISLYRNNNQDYFTALYRRYECFPTTTNDHIYLLSALNPNEAWLGNGTSTPDPVQSSLAADIWANRPYHVVSYFIPYYTYKGDVNNYSDLPTATAQVNDVWYVTEMSRQGYYSFNPNSNTWFKVDAIDKSQIDVKTPAVSKLFASTRAINQSLLPNYTLNYLYSITYVGAVLEQKQMTTSSDAGTWNSINNQEFDISLDAGADKYYKAHVLNVAGWGGSIQTTIKKSTYEYKVPDYTMGQLLNTSPYSSYIDSHDGQGTEDVKENWGTNGIFNDWLAYNRTGYHANGVCLNNLAGGQARYYDISNYDAVYVTARLTQTYSPNHGNQCLWLLVDSADQVIYCEPVDSSGVTTEINYLIDKTVPQFAGACGLVVNRWGNVETEVHEHIKQSGGLNDYITAESAEDYYYYNYAQHVDRTKTHEKGSLYVENPKLIDIYGRIERKVEYKNIGDPNTLVTVATNDLMNAQFDNLEINLTGVDMHYLDVNVDAFDISTSVPVYSAPHGLDKNMPVMSLRIALNSPNDNEISLGESKAVLGGEFNG